MTLKSRHRSAELNPGSMADIAFLLLTFFMVTTVMREEKGLMLLLPPMKVDNLPMEIPDRNLFTIRINSANMLMVEGVVRNPGESFHDQLREFILNRGQKNNLSDSPLKAIVSLKADRGASHETYIHVLDEIQAVYYELYAAQAGVTPERFSTLDLSVPADKALYEKGRRGLPMNISLAD